MERNWYEYLKKEIKSEEWMHGDTDYAFAHGQVAFAWIAELIT